MTPQALRNALDCLVNGVAPNLPSKPGRNAITTLLRAFIASRPAASPAASITTARRLLSGLDDIGLTLDCADAIRDFERAHRARQPWIFAGPGAA